MDFALHLLNGGLGNLAAYLAAHVLLCLIPAFVIAGAMTALIPKPSITRWLGRNTPARVSYPAAAGSQADLRQLGGLAGARLAGHHDHLVVADQFGDLVHVRADRQPLVVLDPRLGDDGGLGHLAGQPRPPYDPTLAPHRAGSPATCAQRVPNTEVVPHEFARDHCQG